MAREPRKRLLLEVAVVTGALLAGASREHAGHGIGLELVAFAALFAPGLVRRALALRGAVEPAPIGLFALEAVALLALVDSPVATWGVLLAALATTLAAWPPLDASTKPASLAGRAGVVLFALAALGAVAHGWHSVDRAAPWAAGPLAVLVFEALASARRATAGDVARETSALALVLASALVHGQWGFPAFEIEAATLVAAWLAALFALLDLVAHGSRRRVGFATIACGVPLLLIWAVGELAIRHVPPSQAVRGAPVVDDGKSFHVPGARYVFEGHGGANARPRDLVRNEFVWNRDGFHDRDHERAKPTSCLRVAIVGDSFVDAYQLRLEDTLQSQLEPRLARVTPAPLSVETLAFGWAGWCQRQELSVLRERVLAYAPDLVVLEFLPSNDVLENDPELLPARGEAQGTLARFLAAVARRRGLYFAGLIFERAGRLAKQLAGSSAQDVTHEVWQEPVPTERAPLWEHAWTITESLVREIADTVEGAGARLVVVVYANEPEVQDWAEPGRAAKGYDFKRPARRMAEICSRRAIPCLELASRFARREQGVREDLFLEGDGHWSSLGHRCAAEEIAAYVASETRIWDDLVKRRR